MNTPLALVGQVDDRDQRIEQLEDENSRLRQELHDAEAEAHMAKREAESAVKNLRKVLLPLYQGLQQVFGEINAIIDEPYDAPAGKQDAKWESIKLRLAPRLREAVDLLLLQGSMRRTQIASALKMDYSNCTKNVIGVLIRQGWLIDNGGNLTLKQL